MTRHCSVLSSVENEGGMHFLESTSSCEVSESTWDGERIVTCTRM